MHRRHRSNRGFWATSASHWLVTPPGPLLPPGTFTLKQPNRENTEFFEQQIHNLRFVGFMKSSLRHSALLYVQDRQPTFWDSHSAQAFASTTCNLQIAWLQPSGQIPMRKLANVTRHFLHISDKGLIQVIFGGVVPKYVVPAKINWQRSELFSSSASPQRKIIT